MMHTAASRMRRVLTSCCIWVCLFFTLTTSDFHRSSEQTLGGLDVFLPYIRDYVSSFQGKSITTWDWKEHLYTYFERQGGPEKIDALNSVDWDVSSCSYNPQIVG
jgi:hypothetical protein